MARNGTACAADSVTAHPAVAARSAVIGPFAAAQQPPQRVEPRAEPRPVTGVALAAHPRVERAIALQVGAVRRALGGAGLEVGERTDDPVRGDVADARAAHPRRSAGPLALGQ